MKGPHLLPATLKWLHCPDLSSGTLPQWLPVPNSRWLCNASIDTRTRRWAVEGMAYLTLDADVKDDFVQDIPALQAMFEMAKASGVLTSGLRKVLLDSGSQGLLRSLGDRTPVFPAWLCSLLPASTWISHFPLSRPHFV